MPGSKKKDKKDVPDDPIIESVSKLSLEEFLDRRKIPRNSTFQEIVAILKGVNE